jgi:biofilm PGA synthesis protein PgaD
MKTPLIIEKPELQGMLQRSVYSMITAIAWGFWFYLLLPALSIVAWFFGLQLFYAHVINPVDGYAWGELIKLAVFVLAALVIIVAWSQYNLRRYGRRNRRTRIPHIDEQTLMDFYAVDRATFQQLRSRRLLTLDYAGDHHPIIVEPGGRSYRPRRMPSRRGRSSQARLAKVSRRVCRPRRAHRP